MQCGRLPREADRIATGPPALTGMPSRVQPSISTLPTAPIGCGPYGCPCGLPQGYQAGPATGMEYPGIVFDGITDKAKTLFFISAHEIGHSWFPMIVGSNERRHAFMDEGFNTFIDIEESAEYLGGKYGPKRDAEYSAGGGS